jgi:4-amino-4-deoxy-L-arabinose transferase-like glycosyltransferase
LGSYPAGFHIDEVKMGWNALSILKTGEDDWGKAFPMYYNSFGDFRPTGYFYTIIPSLILFGQNEFAVRFPSALFGALTVFAIYFLCKELFEGKNGERIGLFAAGLLAVSVWDVSLSRASSEGIVGMFFSLLGLLLFIRLIKQKTLKSISNCSAKSENVKSHHPRGDVAR